MIETTNVAFSDYVGFDLKIVMSLGFWHGLFRNGNMGAAHTWRGGLSRSHVGEL